jgi:hypothetical protein
MENTLIMLNINQNKGCARYPLAERQGLRGERSFTFSLHDFER